MQAVPNEVCLPPDGFRAMQGAMRCRTRAHGFYLLQETAVWRTYSDPLRTVLDRWLCLLVCGGRP